MHERELEEHERQIRDREQYMAAMDAEMCARGVGIRMGQRPDRVRARCSSGDHQPGETAKGFMLWQLMHSLCVKTTPTFKGDGKEDSIQFVKKASDYMEASGIPADDRTEEFKHCL